MNVAELETGLKDLIKEPFEHKEFLFKLLELYNAPSNTIKKLRANEGNKADLVGDILWQRKIYYRAAETGKTALTLDVLKQRKPTKTYKPRFIITTDGKEVSALDMKLDESLHCSYANLNDHFDFFLPLAGVEKYEAIEESKADVKAAARLAKLHDEIINTNPDWKSADRLHALNLFMTRLLFCLFSEDNESFKKDIFVKTVTEYGGENGEHLHDLFTQIFALMNVPESERPQLPSHIAVFPYVNGGLFAEHMEVPKFSKRAKRLLIEAAELQWQDINPDIFGSMIQAVVDDEMRGDLGMHYTSVPNIMKVLQPLFLMSLEEEFAEARENRYERDRLTKLLNRISKIRVFDPACGSGNFLIIAYRELRNLEMRIFQRQDELEGGTITHRWESGVRLSNFYGIEIADFAAETAKLSLWIAEYQMNQRFKALFGETRDPFPLIEGGHIIHNNALHEDWHVACPPVNDDEVETYIVGNPPYLGSTNQSAEQKKDMTKIFAPITKNYKNLDFVAAWYIKAADYCQKQNAQSALVATNSICQGEQVALLWPLIFKRDIEISFAHQSFEWRNLALGNAGITCVIVGLRKRGSDKKILFFGDTIKQVKNIGPYLIEMDNLIVQKSSKPINGLPFMSYGNKPVEGGNLILGPNEKKQLIEEFSNSNSLIKRFYGSQEFIRGIERWCLWIENHELDLAMSIPPIHDRIEKSRIMRTKSIDAGANKLASRAHQFRDFKTSVNHSIIIPKVTTGIREYFPCGILDSESRISDLAFAIYDAPIYCFSIISSKLHVLWIKNVCGKLRSHYRYSNTLGYNTFPIPKLSIDQENALEEHAWEIISARESHPGKTIEWLYNPKTMPKNLLEAHQTLDVFFEKIYIGRPFKDDTERLEHLFKMYEKMVNKKIKKKEKA